ncbi:MAG TPA: MlaD family protein [Actinomycetota bacterium]|nr:MlaD family protein [Actinomycetota bacterium]
MKRSIALVVVTAVFAALALSACGGSKGVTVKARFTDVADLAPDAPVMMADVRIGKVDSITLDHDEALVTMTIDPSARVPQGVIARARRTSLLGERIIDLVVPDTLPANAPLLRDGATITDTIVRPDLEDLVKSGSAALAPVAAGEVATLVDEGAKGFGSSGQDLRTLLNNLHDIVHAYAGRTGDIEAVVTSLNQLNTALASHAPQQGRSVVNTQKALASLKQQMPALKAAIVQLDRLSVGGASILKAHSDEMSDFFRQVRQIAGELHSQQSDLLGILKYAPLHNRNTQMVEYEEFNQVLQDFVICGLNDDPSDPARRCVDDGSGP